MILVSAVTTIVVAVGCFLGVLPFYLTGAISLLLIFRSGSYIKFVIRDIHQIECAHHSVNISNNEKANSLNKAIDTSVIVTTLSLLSLVGSFYAAHSDNVGMSIIAFGIGVSLGSFDWYAKHLTEGLAAKNLYESIYNTEQIMQLEDTLSTLDKDTVKISSSKTNESDSLDPNQDTFNLRKL